MAAYGGFKVISVDYRMPPSHVSTGLDDCLKVWRATAGQTIPKSWTLQLGWCRHRCS